MMRLFASAVTSLFLTLCSAIGQNLNTQIKPKINGIKNANVIEGRCAVIVRPDDRRIKLLKKGISDSDYMTIVSDNQYYLGTATSFLDSVKIRQIEKPSSGIINFKNSSGQYFKVSLNSFDWGIILFNGRTKPINADVTNIEEEYRDYMKK